MEANNESEQQPDGQPVEEAYVAELVDGQTQADESSRSPATEAAEESSVIDAEIVQPMVESVDEPANVVYSPAAMAKPQPPFQPTSTLPSPSEDLAAKGGSVGAIVLGTLALIGSFITSYAVLNSILGLMMGVWGLKSTHKRMAGLGILLCLIAAFFCVVEISSLLPWLWQSDEF